MAFQFVAGVQKSLRRYTKFIAVGGINAVVDLFVLNFLMYVFPTHSDFTLTLYNTLAVGCAVLNSYIWNRRWTFADKADGSLRERCLFVVQAIVNIVANDLTVLLLGDALTAWHVASSDFVVSNLAKGAAMLISSTASYVIMSLVVFRRSSSGKGKRRN